MRPPRSSRRSATPRRRSEAAAPGDRRGRSGGIRRRGRGRRGRGRERRKTASPAKVLKVTHVRPVLTVLVPRVPRVLAVLVLGVLLVLVLGVLMVLTVLVLRVLLSLTPWAGQVCRRASLRVPASRRARAPARSRDPQPHPARRRGPRSATASPGHRPAARSATGRAPGAASARDRCAFLSERSARRGRETLRHRRGLRHPWPAGGTPRRHYTTREAAGRKAGGRTPSREPLPPGRRAMRHAGTARAAGYAGFLETIDSTLDMGFARNRHRASWQLWDEQSSPKPAVCYDSCFL